VAHDHVSDHRGHAIIEQVHADLKNSALAHLPSGTFTANAARLVLAVMAFNLARAAATLTGPRLARATTATIRRALIAVPARIASSARRLPCTCRPAGPGSTPGPACSPTPAGRRHQPPPDQLGRTRPNQRAMEKPGRPAIRPTHPASSIEPRHRIIR
jgi:hypothetical protein